MPNKKLKVGNVPNLRFPGFDNEWEVRKMGEVATFSKGKGISKSDIEEGGTYECIRYGELYTYYGETIDEIKSRTNANVSRLVLSEANDVIIPASGETTIDIATASCVLKSGVVLGGDLNIIKTQNNGVFLSYYLNSKKKMEIANLAQGISVVHLYSSQLAMLNLNLPTLKEQNKISAFLSKLDERIQTQNKIIEGLKLSKQTLIKKIFSRELRFNNDNEISYPDWQIKKLGEITLPVSKRNKNNEKLPVYSINNRLGFVPQNEQFEGISSDDRGYDITLYKVIDKYTFAYNPARINVGSIGYSRDLENIIISSLYVCFITNDYIDDNFLFQYLKTEKFNKEVLKNVEGGVRDYLFYENFARILFEMPCIEEQNKIADFLCTFDNKIDMETGYLKKLEEQKKYLLQNMFV
ncbi:restriction endonuclease subunit S [Flavobacterium sp. F-328]|uniref:Restriction endonuclease subunit S n=1 Tax=Flavobacterium erciyesense TaxID=2825842 RepID=A0ABS5D5X1_9FLAO|nr:restriction endonuclease subunit S [Flavobacterium erciyesense]MBQ0909429.1 restriction endonuclease subunit S [Flavobacterium erciyesense]